MTIRQTLEAIAADLAEHDITLVVPSIRFPAVTQPNLLIGTGTRSDVFGDAIEEHGERIVVLHLRDGFWAGGHPYFKVREIIYMWGVTEIGKRVYDAFTSHGLTVEWAGGGANVMQVNL
jgi:hypothetical protein